MNHNKSISKEYQLIEPIKDVKALDLVIICTIIWKYQQHTDMEKTEILTCLQGMPSFLSLRVRVTSSLWMSPISVSSLATWASTPLPIPFRNSGIPTFAATNQKDPIFKFSKTLNPTFACCKKCKKTTEIRKTHFSSSSKPNLHFWWSKKMQENKRNLSFLQT